MDFDGNINKKYSTRKALLNMRFTEFDLPPMQDVLLIGKRAPIGPEAVQRMIEALAPQQYELIILQDNHIEAVAVKITLYNLIGRDILIKSIVEEANRITDDKSLVKAKLDITITVSKEVDI